MYSFRSGSVRNSPNDEASVPASHADAPPIDGSSYMQESRLENTWADDESGSRKAVTAASWPAQSSHALYPGIEVPAIGSADAL
jgi:hypothetical protein